MPLGWPPVVMEAILRLADDMLFDVRALQRADDDGMAQR